MISKRTLFVLLLCIEITNGCAQQTFTVVMEPAGTKILQGFFQREDLEQDTLFTWFKANYDAYHLDSETVNQIAPLSKGVKFVTVIGTWCGDSKREVPKLFKIFDAIDIPRDNVILFGVDRTKRSSDGTTEQYNVKRVPTVIVFRDGEELGRIVESPRKTFELDLLKLLNR